MPFDKGFIKTLEYLNILARRHIAGQEHADRQTQRKGASVEFSDYRHYSPGDEIRYIDWNVYARHGDLFVKEFTAEENIHVSILLDTSASMEFGNPPKIKAARELAAAIGYIGLVNFDTVSLYTFSQELEVRKKFLRGKGTIFDLLAALDSLPIEGTTDMRAAFRASIQKLKGRSLIVLISDFYDAAGYSEAIQSLRSQKFHIHLIHMVAPEEADPPWRGKLFLRDLETGRQKELRVSSATVDLYRARFAQFCEDLSRFSLANELYLARVSSDAPLERTIVDVIRKGGILEHR